tara:strand:- start:575 stop:718 length:144 start_codon:yes stop_codon:yes gene_type:complete
MDPDQSRPTSLVGQLLFIVDPIALSQKLAPPAAFAAHQKHSIPRVSL